MYNFTPWYQQFSQTVAQSHPNPINSFTGPSNIGYGAAQPMDIQITMHPKLNIDFLAIAKDFVEKYFDANKLGIALLGHYYNAQSLFSINIHHGNQHTLFELISHHHFINKMADLGIHLMRYYDLACTTQPIGKHRILITTHGKVDCNGFHHNVIITLILKIIEGTPRITNHILEIFV